MLNKTGGHNFTANWLCLRLPAHKNSVFEIVNQSRKNSRYGGGASKRPRLFRGNPEIFLRSRKHVHARGDDSLPPSLLRHTDRLLTAVHIAL